MNRRHFLHSAGAAALGLAALPQLLRADDKNINKTDPFGGFALGVQSYTFRNFDLEPALKRTQALGLHYIEFFRKHVPPDASADKIKAVLNLCKDYDIKPIAFG